MYQDTTTEFNNIISGDSRVFHARMVCGEEILTGFKSIKLLGQANEDTETISIGGTVSSCIEVSMDKPGVMITGKEYILEIGLQVGDGAEWVPMGVFTPQSPKETDGLVIFSAYDRMISKMEKPYFSKLTYPVDGKMVLQEIATQTGIIVNLSNLSDGILISARTQIADIGTQTVNPFDGYTYREAVKYLAQMYGKFATFNRVGELELRWYTETGFITNRIYSEPETSERVYELQKIVCAVGENTLEAGSGTTGIVIENPVMTQEILDSVFEQIGGMEYLPTTCSFFGDIRLDLGDIITIRKRNGVEIKVPIMRLVVDYDGGAINEVGSYGNTVAEENLPKGPMAIALERVYTELFLVNTVLANKVSTDVLEANYATITQLNAVSARIDKITATDITTEYLEANYAKINMANVDTAVIRQGFLENLMVSQGIIADRVVGSEVVATDVLTGVNIYANDITAGTLSVERLVLRGNEESLVYALNNSGDLESTVVDTLNGDIITDRTITADKIVAQSITANEIASETITGEQIKALSITADKIFATSLESIVAKIGGFTIGSKALYNGTNSMTSTTAGVYVGTDGIRQYKSTNAYVNIQNGVLTANGANITGTITTSSLSANGGTIGGFTIGKTALYNGRTSMTSTADGVYVGTDGISVYDDGTNCKLTVTSASNTFRLNGGGFNVKDSNGVNRIALTPIGLYFYNSSGSATSYFTQSAGVKITGAITASDTIYANNGISAGANAATASGNVYAGYYYVRGTGNAMIYSDNNGNMNVRVQSANNSGSYRYFSFGNDGSFKALNGGVYWGSYRCVYSGDNQINNLKYGATYLHIDTASYGTFGCTWFVSDRRLKKNIEDTDVTSLSVINSIRHRKFDWKDETKKSIKLGYVAHELQELDPDLVFEVPQSKDSEYEYLLQIDDTKLLPYITKGMQELYQIIEKQQKEIVMLKQQIGLGG